LNEVKDYWSQRAVSLPQAATTNDLYFRRLEAEALISELKTIRLPPGARVLDIGCGDGETTSAVARNFPTLIFQGIDFSAEMINLAKRKAEAERITFAAGDLRNLQEQFSANTFNVIMTNRCLINLLDKEEQFKAIEQIAGLLVQGGYFLGTENFMGGQTSLNSLRLSLSLGEIPIRWHNLYFDEAEFLERSRKFFRQVELKNFSSTYYLVTRVVYSALCKAEGVEPDYNHPIHKIATALPPAGDFSPIKLIKAQA
jgi:ubiquinone/menaquinone biosynthesis C-methylase UbiE